MLSHNGRAFTTKDRNNDPYEGNCAVLHHGAWWYNHCFHSSLNGIYLDKTGRNNANGIVWYLRKKGHDSMKRASMKIRPNN